jgi:hypothetical protein
MEALPPQIMILQDGGAIVPIHFTYLAPKGVAQAEGQPLPGVVEQTWKIACCPNLVEFSARFSKPFPYHRTNDPRATTCPNCKATEAYKRAADALRAIGAMK